MHRYMYTVGRGAGIGTYLAIPTPIARRDISKISRRRAGGGGGGGIGVGGGGGGGGGSGGIGSGGGGGGGDSVVRGEWPLLDIMTTGSSNTRTRARTRARARQRHRRSGRSVESGKSRGAAKSHGRHTRQPHVVGEMRKSILSILYHFLKIQKSIHTSVTSNHTLPRSSLVASR